MNISRYTTTTTAAADQQLSGRSIRREERDEDGNSLLLTGMRYTHRAMMEAAAVMSINFSDNTTNNSVYDGLQMVLVVCAARLLHVHSNKKHIAADAMRTVQCNRNGFS